MEKEVNEREENRVCRWSFTTDLRGLGFKDEDVNGLYYRELTKTLTDGLRRIHDEGSLYEMLSCTSRTGLVELYVEHSENWLRANNKLVDMNITTRTSNVMKKTGKGDVQGDYLDELDTINETLDPNQDIDVVEKFIRDEDEDSGHDGKENYLDNSDVESLNEEILEDGITKMMRTRVKFPRYDENCKTVSFLLGQSFTDHMQFKKALLKYAVQEKRDYIFVKNARFRVRVKCKDVRCNWLVYAANVKYNGKKYFLVKTLNEKHTCSKVFVISHLKSPWIAEQWETMIYAHPSIKSTYIQETIKEQLELEVTKNQCKKAKAIVMKMLEMDVQHEYRKLYDYAGALVNTNLGTSVDIQVEHMGHGITPYFKRMYVCLDAVRKGFLNGCRKYLGLDGCFLKGVVKGVLLTTVGKDPNNQMFPLAWAIGLLNAVKAIFPRFEHRLCARHIYANWYSDFRGEKLKIAFYTVAKCADEAQLKKRLDEIENIQDGAKQTLENRAIQQWCRAYFKTHSKCDSIDNNSTEAWNCVLIAARSKPIISMNEDLKEYLMERRIKRLNFAHKWRTDYGPNIRDIVNENSTAGCKWKIKWNGDQGFQVYYETTQHCVYIAIRSRARDPFDFVDKYYSKDKFIAAYSYPIEVVGSEEFWPNSGRGDLLPPLPKVMPGRPRKARRKWKFEPKKSKTKLSRHGRDMHCGICKSSEHNKRSCSSNGDAPVV
ncbi:elongation factor G, III-V domain-containing protein [Tanacetum coccineum]